eukprot:TRINITY_DN67803_c0_g1_i1.p1 TRINITY_DN67803_c0_g1~~TRINITY_DN67803_c0_g1_i1.p1  ORF type:complete len:492 (+),score=58.19 TRINITY_DN67803_c0_g1_i1:110-1585(+)
MRSPRCLRVVTPFVGSLISPALTASPVANSSLSTWEPAAAVRSATPASTGFATTAITKPFGTLLASTSVPPNEFALLSQPTTTTNSNLTADAIVACVALGSHPSPASFLTDYARTFARWLAALPYQEVVATLVLIAGICCAWDGPQLWQILFSVAVAVLSAGIARFEAKAFAAVAPKDFVSDGLVVILTGIITFLATWLGFQGFQVLFGAALGILGAHNAAAWVRRLAVEAPFLPGLVVSWYGLGAGLGLILFTVWRKPMLATLSPCLGGFLIASAVGFLTSRCATFFSNDAKQRSVIFVESLPDADLAWIDAASALLSTASSLLFVWLGCCGLCAALMLGHSRARQIVVSSILLGMTLYAIVSCTGCPWLTLEKSESWRWLICGGAVWALVAALSTWRQLGLLSDTSAMALFLEGSNAAGDSFRGFRMWRKRGISREMADDLMTTQIGEEGIASTFDVQNLGELSSPVYSTRPPGGVSNAYSLLNNKSRS